MIEKTEKKEKEEQGFFKSHVKATPDLTKEQRTLLIRRGNEFFNKGDIPTAKKIFITTKYSDGLIRLGDYYFTQKEPIEAYKMYLLAPAKEKAEKIAEKMVDIIRKWLSERGKEENDG